MHQSRIFSIQLKNVFSQLSGTKRIRPSRTADIAFAAIGYAVAGLVIFGGYTVLDFNRMRRAGMEEVVPLAAGIFLDVLNIFLFFLRIFGGGRN